MKWNGNRSWTAHTAACAPLCPSFHAISSNCKLSVVSLSSFAAECGKKKQLLVIVLPRTVLVPESDREIARVEQPPRLLPVPQLEPPPRHKPIDSVRSPIFKPTALYPGLSLFICMPKYVCSVRPSLYCTWVPGLVHSTYKTYRRVVLLRSQGVAGGLSSPSKIFLDLSI